jgi:hypothetical protein
MLSAVEPLAEGRFLVRMSDEDWVEGAAAGRARDEENQLHPFRHQTHGAEESRSLEYSVRGSVGEMAVCVFLGIKYGGKGILGEVDIASRYEVKSSAHPCLLLNGHVPGVRGKADIQNAIYIATRVVEQTKEVVLLGWIHGDEAISPEYWADHFGKGRPCYKVDAGFLNPITTLPFLELFPNRRCFNGGDVEGASACLGSSMRPGTS